MKSKRAALPYVVWSLLFILGPILITLFYAFGQDNFTLANIGKAFSGEYFAIFLKSLLTALMVAAICLLAGYPAAYIVSRMKAQTARFVIVLMVLPMWINFLLRTYAWRMLLDDNGIINQLLMSVGIPAQQLLYTQGAVVMGLTYDFLPFMILPIYTALQKIDNGLLEASSDLGANRLRTFARVIFPLSLPGIITGIVMVFMPAITTFVVTELLGGGKYNMYGDLITEQFLQTRDWNFGSALAVVMFLLMAVSMVIIRHIDKDGEGYVL
jgi:ABC-type spermidine/putrescine transport system, permease component I